MTTYEDNIIILEDGEEELVEVKKIYPDPNENKISLSENIDGVKLKYIIEHCDEYQDLLVRSDSRQQTFDQIMTILKKTLKKYKKGKIKVNYKQNNKQGRYFGTTGLQNIPRVVRHTIAKEFYDDVDIKNCHPVCLAHYCDGKGLAHTQLSKYIANRDGYFALLQEQKGLDKGSAKKLLLAIINGKELRDEDKYPEEIIDYYNELLKIRESIMKLEPALVKLAKKNLKKKGKSEYNLDGSVVNLLMCDWENRILIEMVNYFASKKFNVDVLVFDGCMVRKNESQPLTEAILKECQVYIEQQLGIKIQLVIKPMNEDIEIPTESLSNGYEEMKSSFEEHNFKCIDKSSFYNTEYNMVRVKTKSDLVASYEHLTFVNDDCRDECFIKRWLKDSTMRTYEFVECIPPPLLWDEKTTFNLWNGFDIDNIVVEDLSVDEKESTNNFQILLDHIRLLSNNDEQCFQFVLKWLACLFQRPAEKNNVALLFKSKQGMGKDLFYQMLEKMIGQKYSGNTARPERDIFGDFNVFLRNKILVVMNELDGKVGYKYSEKLKDLITNIKEPIRKMRTDVSETDRSFAHYMFFTNKDFPIKVERGDRRLFVSEVTQPVPPKEYFDTVGSAINDRKALRQLYDYLKEIDISKVDWIKDKPMTEYMADILDICTDREISFLTEKLKNAYVEKGADHTLEISSKNLLTEFQDENLCNGLDYKTNAIKFGIKIKNYRIKGWSSKKTKKGNVYLFELGTCIKWFIQEKYIPSNWLSLDDTHPRLLGQSCCKEDDSYDPLNGGILLR